MQRHVLTPESVESGTSSRGASGGLEQAVSHDEPLQQVGGRTGGGRRGRRAAWVSAAILAMALTAYAVTLATKWAGLNAEATFNTDLANLKLLGEALLSGNHGTLHLGNAGYDTSLFLNAFTHLLPGQPGWEEAWPYATYVLGAVITGWSVKQVAGRWAGAISGILCLCITPPLLYPLIGGLHELTVFNTMVLGALFVGIAAHRPGSRWWPLVTVGAVAGVLTGANAVSDHLLLLTGVIPFGVALVALGVAWRDRIWVTTLPAIAAGVAGAGVGAYVTFRAASHFGIAYQDEPVGRAQLSQVPANLHYSGGVVRALFGGSGQYTDAEAVGTGEWVLGVLLCIGVAALVVAAIVFTVRRRGPAKSPADRGRVALVVFWTTVAAAITAVLLLSNAPYDLLSAVRYGMTLWPAFAILIALAITRRAARWPAAVVTAVIVALNTAAVAALPSPYYYPTSAEFAPVIAALQTSGVTHGYADYWEASPTTWVTGGAITLRAVSERTPNSPANTYCNPLDHGMLCEYQWMSADSWYSAVPGKTAVVVDSRRSVPNPPSAVYGSPVRVIQVGIYSIYIYDHDLPLSLPGAAPG